MNDTLNKKIVQVTDKSWPAEFAYEKPCRSAWISSRAGRRIVFRHTPQICVRKYGKSTKSSMTTHIGLGSA